ncbi:MAG: hypothetical protein KJ042_15780, partial [Deltaproteobacteria bacterium]|nr:hypothetical protein [Deltaproteobacteria bacterium]
RRRSPEMAERELRVITLAYNLVRATMLEAAGASGNSTSRVSFMGTIARIRQWAPILAAAIDGETVARLYGDMLRSLAEDQVPDRPNRLEPRATKRRPKNYQRLTKPRREFREAQHRSKSTRPLTECHSGQSPIIFNKTRNCPQLNSFLSTPCRLQSTDT